MESNGIVVRVQRFVVPICISFVSIPSALYDSSNHALASFSLSNTLTIYPRLVATVSVKRLSCRDSSFRSTTATLKLLLQPKSSGDLARLNADMLGKRPLRLTIVNTREISLLRHISASLVHTLIASSASLSRVHPSMVGFSSFLLDCYRITLMASEIFSILFIIQIKKILYIIK